MIFVAKKRIRDKKKSKKKKNKKKTGSLTNHI